MARVSIGNIEVDRCTGCQGIWFDSLEDDYMLVRPKNQQSGCYGDSGGPNYMTIGGTEVVAGVTSFGTEDSCLAGFGGNTDVGEHCNVFLYYYPKVDTDVFCL